MTASVAIPADADLPAIAQEAGNADFEARRYVDGRLYVDGVTQAALTAAATKVGGGPVRSPAQFARTYKADIWRRATDTEVQQLDAALDEAPARLRRLFNDSQVIMHEAEEFPALRASVASIVGEDRADVLLAASFYGG